MFNLGAKSLANLNCVHPALIACVKDAIQTSREDFAVHEGLRSLETQQNYYNKGVSKTMNSKHLKQKDGFAHAVDLVPYINGVYRWEWPLIYPIAAAMQGAAIRLGVKLRWGAIWDHDLARLTGSLMYEVQAYKARHPGTDFLDGPHYELIDG